jgi:hypothetical protein
MPSPRRRQRRCVICKKGFVPNARLGDRQRTCDEAKCRHELRLRNQAAWRQAHPGYFIAWRAKERAERNAEEPVDPPRVPPPLTRLPWEMAQEEFGVAGADFLGSLGRLLLGAKSSIRSQPPEGTQETAQVAPGSAKSSIQSQPCGSPAQSGQIGAG